MRRSIQRQEELNALYGQDMRPATKEQMEWMRKKSARYILFDNHDMIHGYCEKCQSEVTVKKTRHRQDVMCPKCRAKLKAEHKWRRNGCESQHDWYAIAKAIDDKTLMLRYFWVTRWNKYEFCITERARQVYNFRKGVDYCFSRVGDEYIVDNRYYFTEFFFYTLRASWCQGAKKVVPGFKKELLKINDLRYLNNLDKYLNEYLCVSSALKQLMSASLYEKMEKVGLKNIAWKDFCNWEHQLRYPRSETSLTKMLKIDRTKLRVLQQYDSIELYEFLKKEPDAPIIAYDLVGAGKATLNTYHDLCEDKSLKTMKTLNYANKNNISLGEYLHYVGDLRRLEYPLDNSYLFPKDFYEAELKIGMELSNKNYSKQNALISKISKSLREMKDLQDYMNGKGGLLVYVPETAYELQREGRVLHNCIGNYVDRIAEGKTLVFFIRELNNPTAPFVAMEYSNGEVIQVRYDHNEAVKDEKILDFVDAFAEKLRKRKVLVA